MVLTLGLMLLLHHCSCPFDRLCLSCELLGDWRVSQFHVFVMHNNKVHLDMNFGLFRSWGQTPIVLCCLAQWWIIKVGQGWIIKVGQAIPEGLLILNYLSLVISISGKMLGYQWVASQIFSLDYEEYLLEILFNYFSKLHSVLLY